MESHWGGDESVGYNKRYFRSAEKLVGIERAQEQRIRDGEIVWKDG